MYGVLGEGSQENHGAIMKSWCPNILHVGMAWKPWIFVKACLVIGLAWLERKGDAVIMVKKNVHMKEAAALQKGATPNFLFLFFLFFLIKKKKKQKQKKQTMWGLRPSSGVLHVFSYFL